MIKEVYKNITNRGTRKKVILHLLFTITNYTYRLQRDISCNSVIQSAPFFQGFELHYQRHWSEGWYWSPHPQPVPRGTCIMDLAGSWITHIDKLSSAQPRCLLKGQQDGTWVIWKISGCLKVTQGLSWWGFIHLEAGFWDLCYFLLWSDVLQQEAKAISKKSPMHSSSISQLGQYSKLSLLLSSPAGFCLQICIHSSASVMSAITAS